MLDFWYSERCTRGIKLGICIATCVIIYLSSTIEKLPALFVVMSLLLGMIHHFLQQKISRIQADNPYTEGFSIIGFVFPIMALITLFSFLPQPHQWILAIQVIGFSALACVLVILIGNK